MIFQEKKVIDDIQASLTSTTIEHSYSVRKNNPYFLQEAEEQEYEEANTDADVTSEANKIDKYNNGTIISME